MLWLPLFSGSQIRHYPRHYDIGILEDMINDELFLYDMEVRHFGAHTRHFVASQD
jgi:hypothetical protein